MRLSQRRLSRPSLGGLLATRQGSLLVALLCAICAAVLIFVSLSRYKAQVRTPPPQATVLVATSEIPKGTTGATMAAEKLYAVTPVTASQITPGAISDAAALANATAQTTILPGQQLTAADFAAAGDVASTLLPNQRAISVTIDEAHGDTDVLQPGDHVDIYATFSVARHGQSAVPTMVLLVPDALVIKPASAVPVHVGATTVTGSSLVLAVSAAQAPEVGFAADNGKLFLALRPTDASAPAATPVTQTSLVNAALAQATVLSSSPPHTSTPSSGGAGSSAASKAGSTSGSPSGSTSASASGAGSSSGSAAPATTH
ncbi:MAG TPA: Flp pilus assembly protein CpaB [Solirubrobacteraceae bacterium]|nr:Flp pilus assembly protein CpaB [Solirubrobacteraceae bacterium]